MAEITKPKPCSTETLVTYFLCGAAVTYLALQAFGTGRSSRVSYVGEDSGVVQDTPPAVGPVEDALDPPLVQAAPLITSAGRVTVKGAPLRYKNIVPPGHYPGGEVSTFTPAAKAPYVKAKNITRPPPPLAPKSIAKTASKTTPLPKAVKASDDVNYPSVQKRDGTIVQPFDK